MTPAPTHHTAPAGGSGTYRDQWGIPHLWAETADELAFLQGMNAATDRSWQIELERWRSEGRTAEILGADALPWDRFARQARLDDTARRCFENLDAGTQRWCGQYVAGVNQALAGLIGADPSLKNPVVNPSRGTRGPRWASSWCTTSSSPHSPTNCSGHTSRGHSVTTQ
jgi:penicillin amidase